jgi:hypothetical protein
MLVLGLFGAYHHAPCQSDSRDEEIAALSEAILAQGLPRASPGSFDSDLERGPVLRFGEGSDGAMPELLIGGLRADEGGKYREDHDLLHAVAELFSSSVPTYRVSMLADCALGMTRGQLELFAGSVTATLNAIDVYEFDLILGWERWDMRDLEARLGEVIACLDDPVSAARWN